MIPKISNRYVILLVEKTNDKQNAIEEDLAPESFVTLNENEIEDIQADENFEETVRKLSIHKYLNFWVFLIAFNLQ